MADNNAYVIQIDNPTNNPVKQAVLSQFNDDSPDNFELSLPNSSRRTSISSHQSSQLASNLSICYSPVNYDSGNFSICELNSSYRRPPSLSSAEDEPFTPLSSLSSSHERELREKNQFLFLAQQDMRKLKSEVDRLNKSEKWYKNELKLQKRSRLEILEKLYLNERNYFRENQNLQSECKRLYGITSDVEKRALQDKEILLRQLKDEQDTIKNISGKGYSKNTKFEIRKLRSTIQEHEQLIIILRRQKQSLLNDLRNLTTEKDSKIILLEKNIASLDEENRKIVEQCKKVILEKNQLENVIKLRDFSIKQMSIPNINITMQNLSCETLENIKIAERSNKISSFCAEDQSLSNNLFEKPDIENNVIVNVFSNENNSNSNDAIINFDQTNENSDPQQRECEELHSQLQEKAFEIENLKSFNTTQNETISQLQAELAEYKKQHENLENSFKIKQENLKAQDSLINDLQDMMETKKIEMKFFEQRKLEIEGQNKKLLINFNNLKEDLANRNIDLNHSNKEILSLKNIVETQKEEISLMLREKNTFENLQIKYDNISIILNDKTSQLFQQNSELEQLKFENNKLLSEKEEFLKMPNEIQCLKLQLETHNSELKKLIIINKELEDYVKYHKLNNEKEEFNKEQVYEQLCGSIRTMETELKICNLNYEKLKSELLTKNTTLENMKIIFEKYNLLIQKLNVDSLAVEIPNNNKLEVSKYFLGEENNEWQYLLENFHNTQQIVNKTFSILNSKNSEIEKLKTSLIEYTEKCEQLYSERLSSDTQNSEKLGNCFKDMTKIEEDLKLQLKENEKLISDKEITHNNLVKLQENVKSELLMKNQHIDERNTEVVKLSEELFKLNNNYKDLIKYHQNSLDNLQTEFSKETDNNKKLIQSLKTDLEFKENEINNLIAEKIQFENKIQLLDNEKNKYNEKIQNLRDAGNRKLENCTNCENYQQEKQSSLRSSQILYNNLEVNNLNSSPNDLNDELKQMKLLNNVIEIEHKKKLARYEVHIRTLLANIKSYKKNLEIVENQYGKLLTKYESLENSTHQEKSDESLMKKLAEMSKKYEESLKIINVYKNQLETAQSQLKNIEDYKHVNNNLKCNLSNLMDDYKMLIHQKVSLNINKKKSNSTVDFSSIYNLIYKSNNYVPNLNNLTISVNDLKFDIENLKSLNNNQFNLLWPPIIEKRKSLMDEFKEISLDGKL